MMPNKPAQLGPNTSLGTKNGWQGRFGLGDPVAWVIGLPAAWVVRGLGGMSCMKH